MSFKEQYVEFLGESFTWFAKFTDDHMFMVSFVSFAILFAPVWIGFLMPAPRPPAAFLDPEKWQKLPLVEKEKLSHNTRRFRFALTHREQQLGLPIGQHITLKAPHSGEGPPTMRPYTPTSDDDQRGFVDFVIKVYPEGRMSQHMDSMKLGHFLEFKGPKGRFTYQRNSKRAIGMLAGGTGVTPMFQVVNAILRDPLDKTQLSLIFANVTEDDILLRRELDTLAAMHANFSVHYVLNDPPAGWQGGVGFVSAQTIKELLPAPADDILILRCGPLPMNKAMEAHLDALSYSKESQFQF